MSASSSSVNLMAKGLVYIRAPPKVISTSMWPKSRRRYGRQRSAGLVPGRCRLNLRGLGLHRRFRGSKVDEDVDRVLRNGTRLHARHIGLTHSVSVEALHLGELRWALDVPNAGEIGFAIRSTRHGGSQVRLAVARARRSWRRGI